MRVKKMLVGTAKSIPPLNKYLNEKVAMGTQLTKQAHEMEFLSEQNGQYLHQLRLLRGEIPRSQRLNLPVFEHDILAAFSGITRVQQPPAKKLPPFTINWVIPPMGSISGGHSDIFRAISYLESRGHKCRIYFYDALFAQSLSNLKKIMKENYPAVKSAIYYNAKAFNDADIIFATNWFTVYPVFNSGTKAKKYYFVQDFEPYFDPIGFSHFLAEKTYRLGFRGITLGKWLAKKLTQEYKMDCTHLEFGTDTRQYYLLNQKRQKSILFYARPFTARRGFELGIMALKLFHERLPEFKIQIAGWDTSQYKIPFPYTNHGTLPLTELNKLYNQCIAGLVVSFTNMSLLPLDMLAAGCIPVVNDSENTHMVDYKNLVEYADGTPQAMADKLIGTVQAKDLLQRAKHAAKQAKNYHWDKSDAQLEQILIKDLS